MGGATQDKQPWTATTAKGIKPLGYASPPVCTSVSTQSCDWCFHQQKRINRQIQMQDAPLTQLCGMKENNYLAPVSARSQLLERTCSAVHRRVVNQRVLPLDEVGTTTQTWCSRSQTLYLVSDGICDCFLRDRTRVLVTIETAFLPLLSGIQVHARHLDLKAEEPVHTVLCRRDK